MSARPQRTRAAGRESPACAIAAALSGSMVLTPVVNAFGRVKAYEVIDGQQRTTTLPPLTQDAGMYGRKFLLGTQIYIQVRPFRLPRLISYCID